MWLNSGDEMLPAFQESKFVQKSRITDAALVCGCNLVIDHQSNKVLRKQCGTIAQLPSHTLPHNASAFRTDKFKEFDGYNEKYNIVGDRELILRFYLNGAQIEFVNATITKFYTGGISGTAATNRENLTANRDLGLIGNVKYLLILFKRSIKSFLAYLAKIIRWRRKM